MNATLKESPVFSRIFAEQFLQLSFAGAAGKYLESCAGHSIQEQLLDRHIVAVRGLSGHSRVLLPQHGGGFHLLIDFKHSAIEQAGQIGTGLARTFHYNLTQVTPGHKNTLDVSMKKYATQFYQEFARTWIDLNELHHVLDFVRQVPRDGTLLSLKS